MSISTILGSITSLSNQIQTGVGTVSRAAADLGLGSIGGTAKYWKDTLQPASFKGVPFGVLGGDSHFGRRTAVHEYPFRDTVWVEDMGRSVRHFQMQGFLVGDDCIAQRELLIAACEVAGPASLVHPTFGALTVTLVGPITLQERWDRGRVFEFSFSLIESGDRVFPTIAASTSSAVTDAASAADTAANMDFTSQVTSALTNGAAVVKQAVSTAGTWARTAQRLATDATNLHNMVGSLPGSLGRFAGGRSTSGLSTSAATATGSVTTVASLIAAGARARSVVTSAATSLLSFASGL